MSKVEHVKITPEVQKQIDAAIRKVKGSAAVEAMIEQRLSYRDATEDAAGWGAYQRYILSDGFTVYVSLNTLAASKSPKPAKGAAYRRYVARQARAEKATVKAEAKAKAEALQEVQKGKLSIEAAAEKVVAAGKAATKTKKAKKVPVVKYDPTLATVKA